jgi:3-hydroxybutyryl-CoA dehydrogenase
MQIIVLADEAGKEEFNSKKISTETPVIFIEKISEISNYSSADTLFVLKEIADKEDWKELPAKHIFINSVVSTLKELNLPEKFSRVNGWPGFLNREVWEIATNNGNVVKDIFNELKWKYTPVADEPGLVSARIISMIINEAYFALGENVSDKDEIDLAMKLGTNYPYGPFEWSEKIGLQKIHDLLKKLSETDRRYNIAPAIKTEIFNN